MDIVQQVSVQIAAASLGDAKALTDELERHRRVLRQQPGFRSMQIARSEEPTGDSLLTVETRWRDGEALSAYTDQPANVFGIINKHGALAVPGTTQVRRMEAVDDGAEAGNPVYERLAWAFLVPVGAVSFGLAIIFGLSRVYLASSAEAATVIAALVAIGILAIAAYFASNVVPRWQYAGAGIAVAALLIGGTIWGQINYEPSHGEAVVETPEPPRGTPVPPGQIVIETHDNFFTLGGSEEKNPNITVPAGTALLPVNNAGKAIHNLHIAAAGGFVAAFCKPGGDEPCSDPGSIRAGAEGEITLNLAPGSYTYRCDFHVAEMQGTIEIQ